MTHYGFNWTLVLINILIFSEAAQFTAAALAVSGAGVVGIALTILFLNLRNPFPSPDSNLQKYNQSSTSRAWIISWTLSSPLATLRTIG